MSSDQVTTGSAGDSTPSAEAGELENRVIEAVAAKARPAEADRRQFDPPEFVPPEFVPPEFDLPVASPAEATRAELGAVEASRHDGHLEAGIDTIRDLLRKLEDAAAELPRAAIPATDPEVGIKVGADQDTGPAEPTLPAINVLSTLRRSPSVASAPLEIAPIGIAGQTIGVRAQHELVAAPTLAIEVPSVTPSQSRHVGWAIAVGSFALGVTAAAGLILAIDPFKKAPQQIVAKAPVLEARPASHALPVAEQKNEPAMTPPAAAAPPLAPPPSAPVPSIVAQREPGPVLGEPPLRTTPVATKSVGFTLAADDRVDLRPGDRKAVGLRLEPMPTDTDAVLVVLRGVPEWLNVSKGSTIGDEIWLLPGHHAADLALVAGENASGNADIRIQLAHLDGRILAETRISVRATRASQPSPMMAAVPEAAEQNTLRMLARGELLLDTGEIEAARLLLRTAAEGGSLAAALRLAQTYDPAEMQRLGMADASADATQAVRWYEKAHALGSPSASARISALSAR